jgi:dihydrofolate reductase
MALNLIFARARNGVIGHNNTLPWHLPEDLAHFKATTLGQPVIMGRKTWDSLPVKFRPLPGRMNIVVTRQTDWHSDGAHVVHSIDEALQACPTQAQPWVIGGAELYRLAMPLATRVVVTEIDAEYEGDAFAPELDASWQEASRTTHVAANGLHYSLVNWVRK